MTDTTNLGLPFIEASQAQKHVTHNEALRILDAVIQVTVQDRTRTAPPASPVEGQRHIVAVSPTGAWASRANTITTWQDGAWAFLVPKTGWCVWSVADDVLVVFDGAIWRDQRNLALDNAAHVGVNTTASAPNLLSVRSSAALFAAINTADGGSGDVRLQLSKESAAKTASVYFSDAYSGRAEFGLIGSDAFKLKVSADGSSFVEALTVDQTSGNLALPRGLLLTGVISPSQITTNPNDYAPSGFATACVVQLSTDAGRSLTGLAGGAEGRVVALVNVGTQPLTLMDESASSTAANRFACGGDLLLTAKQAALLRYDGTAARWRVIAGGTSAGRGELGPGTIASAVTAIVIPVPATGNAFELSGHIVPAADAEIVWVASFDGGATYKTASSDYYNYGIRNLGGSIGSISTSAPGGFIVGSPAATFGLIVPSQFQGVLLPGSATQAAAMDITFAGSSTGATPFDNGHIQTRVNSVSGRLTHIKIVASVSNAIAAGSCVSMKVK